jgi:hypothetical protein
LGQVDFHTHDALQLRAVPCPKGLMICAPCSPAESWGMIKVIKHEAVPKCGSYEVRFPDGGRPGISTGTTCPAGGCGLTC